MSLSEIVAPHLPYLRRFARSLTGDQSSGDKYVAAVLEALIEDSSLFTDDGDPRVTLYGIFLKVWDSVDINLDVNGSAPTGDAAHQKLSRITPKPRQAFLLASVEDFTTDETAEILSVTPEEVASLIDQASREIADQVRTQVLIIEDEPLISLDLEDLVRSMGHDVTGIARTHSEAIKLAKEQQPGLVLADIQLADGSSGLDAVNEMLEAFQVPVIFITAYPDRLLTGTRPEPTFLITKPFKAESVKAVVSQSLFFDQAAGGNS